MEIYWPFYITFLYFKLKGNIEPMFHFKTLLPTSATVSWTRFTKTLLLLKCNFPDSSVGKESACNRGDPSLIPWSGRSAGEGMGYPLQYSGLENFMDCVSPRVHKESDMTEQLSLSTSLCSWAYFLYLCNSRCL